MTVPPYVAEAGESASAFPAAARTEGAMRANAWRSLASFEHGHERRFRGGHRGRRHDGPHRNGVVRPAPAESRALPMNLVSERGQLCPREPVSPYSRTKLSALLSVAGSWSQCMRKIERRLSMNHWTRRKPGCSADSLSAVSPTGSRQEVIFPASGPIADCQSAIQQTASLRYEGRVQGFNARFCRGNLSPIGGEREPSFVEHSRAGG